jgi:competence protein ComEC
MPEAAANTASALGPLSRRPAVWLAVLFAAGILLHPLVPHHPWLLILIVSAIVALAAILSRRPWICSALLAIAVVLTGIGLAQREHFAYSSADIGQFAGDDPRLAEVELRLIDEPRILAASFGQVRPLPPKQVVMTKVLRIKTWHGWIDACGQLPITLDQPHPRLTAGQVIRALGMLQRPSPAMNPGEFDWADYYRRQRILATLNIRRPGNIQIVRATSFMPLTRLRLEARRLLAAGFSSEHAIDHALLRALLLGDRDPQLRNIQDDFEQTGVGYQLSVSGLHVVLLAIFVLWLCRLLCLRPRYSLLIATTFVLLYALVALPSYSGSRSAILWMVMAVAMFTHRPYDRPQLLALAVFAMLLWHPLDIYAGGFQLSVIAVSAITIFLPRVQQLLLTWRDADLTAAGTLYHPSMLEAALSRLTALGIRALKYTLAGWFATLPLIAWQFGQLNPWAIATGAFLLPFVFVALIGGLLKIVFTLLWPSAAGIWAIAAGIPIGAVRHVVDALGRLPGASIILAAPPLWLIIVYYALLLVPLLRHSRLLTGRRRWFLRCAPVVGVTGIFFLPLFPQLQHPAGSAQNLKITLLSLGAGQCAVIEPPGGQPILFDAGSLSVSDLVRKIVGPFLRTQGRRQVEQIFLSHGDYDHISAAGEIASAYGVRAVFISPHFRRNIQGNVPDQTLLETLDKLDLPPRLIDAGDHLDLGGGATVDVLWPPQINDMNSNNAGLVLRLRYAGRTILFPADIQDPALQGVLQNAAQLKADILIAPHHGSGEPLTPAFVQAVHPAIILSSNAWRLTNKQKRFETMIGHVPLYRTNKCGAITVMISPDGKISVDTFLINGRPKP